MAEKIDIAAAFAEIEAGKFSFRMIDAIKDHVSVLESELARVTTAHESAMNELRQQEYTIGRLESDLRKVNARVHALVRANALADITIRETKKGAVMVQDYLPVARDQAVALSKKTITFLSNIDYKGEFEKAKAHPLAQKALGYLANLDLQAEWKKLAAHPQVEKALRELQPLLAKADAAVKDHSPVIRKQVGALVDKASAYISALQKKVA